MLEELRKIIVMEGITENDAQEARKLALEGWIKRYVSELTIENTVLKKNLRASDEEFIKYHLGYQIAEKLLEDHALVVSENNKIKVKVLILNKDFPKNKE